jgi:sensor histidine kinase YesM
MSLKKKDIPVLGVHAFVLLMLLLLPVVGILFSTGNPQVVLDTIMETLLWFFPVTFFYFLNFYLLVPKLYYRNKWVFIGVNMSIVAFILLFTNFFFGGGDWSDDTPNLFFLSRQYISIAFDTLVYILVGTCALGVREILRLQEMEIKYKDVQQKKAEAELVWLKNQLNPHFLFNTLNNISSLVQIDADVAQDNITRLSSLLRYALYGSNKPLVPLRDEVAFMEDYINLMKLRCNECITVDTQFEVPEQSVDIAPLLFISLLENAFKHGTSNHLPSFIKARLQVIDGTIVFTCDNSNFPNEEKRTGKGVGLENLQRRLKLLYPGRHEYIHTLENDVYHVEVKIKI